MRGTRPPNYPMNPSVGVGLGADFVRTLAHRGLWWR
jgi:hypothetical protein